MWILVKVLVLHSLYVLCASNYIPKVEVYMNQPNDTVDTVCKLVSPKLAFGHKYKLSVKINPDDKRKYTGSCTLTNRDSGAVKHFLRKTSNNEYTSTNVKAVARALTCSLNYPHKTLHCGDLSVDIRDPKMGVLQMIVGGEKMITTPASDTESYDAYATYHYKRGVLANISCSMDNTNIFRLIYKDRNGNVVDKTKTKIGSVSMLRKMPADSNGALVECITWDIDAVKSYKVRVNLEEKKGFDENDFGYYVNGLPLSPVQRDADNTTFQYDYYDGEELKILTLNTYPTDFPILCRGNNIPDNLPRFKIIWMARDTNITTVLEEDTKTMSIICTINTSANSNIVTLNLVPNNFDYNPFIKGLSMAKVLSKTHTRNVITIRYDYDGQEIYLRCYSKTSNPQWIFSSQIENVTQTPSNYTSQTNYYVLKGTFKLKPGKLSGEINCTSTFLNCAGANKTACEDNKNITQVILKRSEFTAPTHLSTYRDDGTSNTLSELKGNNKVLPGSSTYIYIAAGAGALVIIVIVLCVVIKVTKQKPRPDPTAINYENLPKHNEGQTDMPSQWNEAQYSVPSDAYNDSIYAQPSTDRPEDLYSKPVPKNQRKDEEPGYATVGEVPPTYAQVLPKSVRAQNGVQVLPSGVSLASKLKTKRDKANCSKTPSESPYAGMGQNDISYANSSCTENLYADVRFNDNPYAEPYSGEKNSYSNVFDNARYVNSNSKGDYVEPTYCDLKK